MSEILLVNLEKAFHARRICLTGGYYFQQTNINTMTFIEVSAPKLA